MGQPTQTLERGAEGLSPEADRASRITVGHAEGMSMAFANLYRDLGDRILAEKEQRDADPMATEHPDFKDGCHTLEVIHAAVRSAREGSRWIEI